MKIIWLAHSRQDLAELVMYVADDNPLAALELDADIIAAAEVLADFPKMGKTGRVEGTRELVVRNNYIIVYEAGAEAVYILAVIHASRQWPPVQ